MIQTKTVDITPMKITLPVIEMSQYDLGREVVVHMKDGSDWFDLTGYTAKLQGTKPSGFGYTVTGTVSGHDITFASNYDMTSEAGFIPSEVRLTKDGVSLGSLNLILHVEKTPHDVTTTDGSPESLIPELTVLVNRAEAAVEVILDCSATATTLPAGSNATASYDVDNGVFTFGIPRGNKGETGDTGATGNGIASIAKTGTSGLVDTYTITFTDGTTTTFTVTNGQNGTGSVADVTQNGVSVLDGTTAKVTVPTYDAVTDNEPYLFRTSGGSVDIGNREVDTLVGGTVAWNQLIPISGIDSTVTVKGVTFTNNGDGTVTINGTATDTISGNDYRAISPQSVISGHKYLFRGCPSGGSRTTYFVYDGYQLRDTGNGTVAVPQLLRCVFYAASGTVFNNVKFVPQIFDLTLMFGTTIADYIYSLEQATAGAGVAWFKKLFPKDYYEYNAGELLSVEGLESHDTVGFNQWDEEWELGALSTTGGNATSSTEIRSKNYIPVVGGQTYCLYCAVASTFNYKFYDADKNFISGSYISRNNTLTIPSDARYMRFFMGAAYGTTYKNDICINISWDGERDGEYEAYVKHSYPLDSSLTLRGIPKLDASNNLYYDGDTYESDGTVTRNYGIVDLGSLTWNYDTSYTTPIFTTALSTIGGKSNSTNCVVVGYTAKGGFWQSANNDKCIACGGSGFNVSNLAYTDATTFKTAMSGVYLVYELATPTTETAEPYTNPQVVDESGTEEYVSTSIVPVGHQTTYPDLFSGDYNDLVNKPTIPTETSQLTNDSDFVIDASYVHTDNNFTTTLKDKLDGIASGAEVNVQADWNEQSSASDAYIANKPTIPTVPAWAQAPSKPTYTASEVGAATADHVHGYITNGGDITASATIANGDRLVINDESASKVLNSSITFGTATNTYLRNNGTWGAPKTSTSASLTVAGWSSSTQTVTVTGVTTTNDVIVSPAPASYDAYVSAGIRCTAQASNSLTFTCTATPSEAITVNVLIIL